MGPPELPRIEALLKPTLTALATIGNAGNADQINSSVLELLGWPKNPILESAKATQFADKLALARSSLKIAGLIALERRGFWILTEAGHQALPLEAEALTHIVRTATSDTPEADAAQPARLDRRERETWQDHLIETILTMKPDGFERLCQRILRAYDFIRVEITGRSGDDGIDGIGVLQVNLLSFHVRFQCKRWRNPVGAPEVRDFRGALTGRAEKGIIFTTSSFTAAAQIEAARPGVLPIDLIDGNALCNLLKERQLGVSVRIIQEVQIEPDFFRLM
eukprot:gene15474-15617_t